MNTLTVDQSHVEVTLEDNVIVVDVHEDVVEVVLTERGPQGAPGIATAQEPLILTGTDLELAYDPLTLAVVGGELTVIGGGGGDASIDDDTISTESTYSSSKIEELIDGVEAGDGGDADSLEGHTADYFLDTSGSTQTKTGDIILGGLKTHYIDFYDVTANSARGTISTTDPMIFDVFDVNTYRSVEYVIQLQQGSNQVITKLIILQDSANAALTEYGTVSLGSAIAYDFDTAFVTTNIEIIIECPNLTNGPVDVVVWKHIFNR